MLKSVARAVVRHFDAFLRRRQGVWEFTRDEACIFRLGWGKCRHVVHLSDGTVLQPGDPILALHLWNEQIPPMLPGGPDLAWGARFAHGIRYSLRLLSAYLQEHSAFGDVRALHGILAVPGGENLARWERMLRHAGFDVVRPERTPWRTFAAFWENLYTWAIIWTFNPVSLRYRELLRLERCHLWLPRSRLPGKRAPRSG